MNHKYLRKTSSNYKSTRHHTPNTLIFKTIHTFHYPYTQFKDMELFIFNANIKEAHISFCCCVQVFDCTVSVSIIIRIYFKIQNQILQ